MRLVRVCNNLGNIIRSHNNDAYKIYTGINSSKAMYNLKPAVTIDDNKNIAQKMDDIDNSLQMICNSRPYSLYFLMHELNITPNTLYIRYWADFRNKEVRAMCIMDQIQHNQVNWCYKNRSKSMIIEELNFMYMLCDMQHNNKKIF